MRSSKPFHRKPVCAGPCTARQVHTRCLGFQSGPGTWADLSSATARSSSPRYEGLQQPVAQTLTNEVRSAVYRARATDLLSGRPVGTTRRAGTTSTSNADVDRVQANRSQAWRETQARCVSTTGFKTTTQPWAGTTDITASSTAIAASLRARPKMKISVLLPSPCSIGVCFRRPLSMR
jgi:hypothetical protein